MYEGGAGGGAVNGTGVGLCCAWWVVCTLALAACVCMMCVCVYTHTHTYIYHHTLTQHTHVQFIMYLTCMCMCQGGASASGEDGKATRTASAPRSANPGIATLCQQVYAYVCRSVWLCLCLCLCMCMCVCAVWYDMHQNVLNAKLLLRCPTEGAGRRRDSFPFLSSVQDRFFFPISPTHARCTISLNHGVLRSYYDMPLCDLIWVCDLTHPWRSSIVL